MKKRDDKPNALADHLVARAKRALLSVPVMGAHQARQQRAASQRI